MASPPERIKLAPLTLRKAVPADAELLSVVLADSFDHLAPWMPWAIPEAVTPAAQREHLAAAKRSWDADTAYEFLLMTPDDGALLGMCGLHRRIGPGAIELGYWLAAGAVGHGHMTTAVGSLTDVALSLPDVGRAEIHCDEANVRSQAVPRRLGYRLARVEPDEIGAPGEVGRSMTWVYPP